MRKFLVVPAIMALLFVPQLSAIQCDAAPFHDKLEEITDARLKTVLSNSIKSGLISTEKEFDDAVEKAENAANNASLGYYRAKGSNKNLAAIRNRIAQQAAPIRSLDKDAVKVKKYPVNKIAPGKKLFYDIQSTIPASYNKALALCCKFNPKVGTNDHKALNKDIDAFLNSIKNDPVIKHALSVTKTTIDDLKSNWFGSGLGFEHVVSGEIKGSKVSGYHWWYRFYADERKGRAKVQSAVAGSDDCPYAYTGSFLWDPDGEGPLPEARKPKGGFIAGNSVQTILALGHIAIEAAKYYGPVPGALMFYADVNGATFQWQLYTLNGTIRSLYPMGSGKVDVNPGGQDSDYYEHQRKIVH